MHLALLALFVTGTTAYTNHTVGGPAGWLFDPYTNTSSSNYTSWAANQTFYLGDYLIFETNSNIQMLVLTYNETTFSSCSIDDSSDSDTFVYGQEREEYGQPLTFAVPLTNEGANYFFSDGSDGIQCENGMAFGINVRCSVGVPSSINQAPVNVDGSLKPSVMFYGVFALLLLFSVSMKVKGRRRISKQVH